MTDCSVECWICFLVDLMPPVTEITTVSCENQPHPSTHFWIIVVVIGAPIIAVTVGFLVAMSVYRDRCTAVNRHQRRRRRRSTLDAAVEFGGVGRSSGSRRPPTWLTRLPVAMPGNRLKHVYSVSPPKWHRDGNQLIAEPVHYVSYSSVSPKM